MITTMPLDTSTRRRTYDHLKLATAAARSPLVLHRDTDPAFPTLNGQQIRHGDMRAYQPAGAFNVLRRNGLQHLVFLGVPTTPWTPTLGAAYDAIPRTLDPDECPEGTPRFILDALRERLEEATQRPDTPKKKGKKKHKRKP